MIEAGGARQVREARAGESYLSSSDPRVHFGIGKATGVQAVTIRWPSGTVQTVSDAVPGRYNLVEEPRTPR